MKIYGIHIDQLHDSDFVTIRSDQGDGGWSIHWKHHEDEDGIPSQILVSGTGSKWLEDQQRWSAPTDEDLSDAIAALTK